MIISINLFNIISEKAFNKIQYLFLITIHKLKIKGDSLNHIKHIYESS